ncbi:heavy-metal-associated domain-containing protein [Agrilactobacillus fermenti]|uniref:heavy-metal-associated domain-containing protein n=1 Tax=Agrilactobacillus fermenti TaxID=2586909 RepID=UPI001E4EB914|nr:heavy metal-associated domain-containing protein [Agrilactobacillus fermenti]MCD2256285.1 heavy-metal-associated domain-containing protein [Agrilactobacillus fermenti]
MTKTVAIKGMKCEGCTENVAKAFNAVAGVDSVKVDLDSKQAVVTGDPKDQDLIDALAETHYSVESIQ